MNYLSIKEINKEILNLSTHTINMTHCFIRGLVALKVEYISNCLMKKKFSIE